MQTETIVSKGQRNGWTATTKYDMGECKDHDGEPARRQLRISTQKGERSGVYTSATCATVHPDGTTMWAVFSDYHKRVANEPVRGTEKAIRDQHATVLAQAEAILADARAFYERKDEESKEELEFEARAS